jgi:hypothetical protein
MFGPAQATLIARGMHLRSLSIRMQKVGLSPLRDAGGGKQTPLVLDCTNVDTRGPAHRHTVEFEVAFPKKATDEVFIDETYGLPRRRFTFPLDDVDGDRPKAGSTVTVTTDEAVFTGEVFHTHDGWRIVWDATFGAKRPPPSGGGSPSGSGRRPGGSGFEFL